MHRLALLPNDCTRCNEMWHREQLFSLRLLDNREDLIAVSIDLRGTNPADV